jgi:hypothetical protein
MAVISAPVKLDLERVAQISTRDEQITGFRKSVEQAAAEKAAISFRFHLEANPSTRTEIKMRYMDTSMMIGVSTLELVVTNGGSRPFDLVACRWFCDEIPLHQAVSPHVPARVNITEQIIAALVGGDFSSAPPAPTTHTLPIVIDCRADSDGITSSEPKKFQIEIVRVTKALNVKIAKVI